MAEALDNAGIDYIFQVDALPEKAAGQELRRNVYLVCKEAAHNIIRHAQATQVHIRIYTDTQLHIEIKDNGKGMPAGEDKRFGNGLRNMQARMERVQGHCSIISDSSGTTVQLSVPV
jgi:signal transduction histidine kinase